MSFFYACIVIDVRRLVLDNRVRLQTMIDLRITGYESRNFLIFVVIMSNRLEELQQFLAESPNDPFLKYAITMEYQKLGDHDKVFGGFQDLRENHPDYVGTYYHFAKFLEEQDRKEEALEVYRVGMEVAQRVRNRHAYGELLSAYNLARGIEEDEWDD